MSRPARRLLLLTAALVGAVLPIRAWADPQVYEYRIEHALYGDIGTLTNHISRSGELTKVETNLHVAVKVFGMVIYRQEAHRIEEWSGDRLVRYRSVTATNGNRLEVRAKADGDRFVITSPSGTLVGHGRIHTTNPWSPTILNADYLMSPRTGELSKARVIGSRPVSLVVDGKPKDLREYEMAGGGRQLLWLDQDNVPIAFQTEDQGSTVDFVATRYRSLGSELREALRGRGDAPAWHPTPAPELAARPGH